jgi:Tfp pilus assembly protein PilO
MSRREQIIIYVGLILIVGVGYYFLAYQAKRSEYERLSTQLEERQKELDRLQSIAKQRPQLEKEYAEIQGFVASVEGKLPTMKEMPTLLVQLERMSKSITIKLQSIRPSPLEAVSPEGQGANAQTPPTGAKAPKAAPAYYRFPIKMTITANYGQVVQLMTRLNDFPRLMRVRRLGVAPRTLPELNLDIDVDTYVLPKEGG